MSGFEDEIAEKVWGLIQMILKESIGVFQQGMHFDTVIFCCLYLILKLEQKNPEFSVF